MYWFYGKMEFVDWETRMGFIEKKGGKSNNENKNYLVKDLNTDNCTYFLDWLAQPLHHQLPL